MAKSGESYGRIFQDFFMAEFSKSDGNPQLVWQKSVFDAIFNQRIWQNHMENDSIFFKISLIHQSIMEN